MRPFHSKFAVHGPAVPSAGPDPVAFSLQNASFSMQNAPFSIQNSPVFIQNSSFFTQNPCVLAQNLEKSIKFNRFFKPEPRLLQQQRHAAPRAALANFGSPALPARHLHRLCCCARHLGTHCCAAWPWELSTSRPIRQRGRGSN